MCVCVCACVRVRACVRVDARARLCSNDKKCSISLLVLYSARDVLHAVCNQSRASNVSN